MDFNQLESIGFNYIRHMLQPVSAVGKARLKKIVPFPSLQTALLNQEWDYLALIKGYLEKDSRFFDSLIHELSMVKDIRGSFNRLKSEVLEETELFEIKAFLSLCEKIKSFFAQTDTAKDFFALVPNGDKSALSLLSKSGAGGFFIGPHYSEKLSEIRREKEKAAKMAESSDNKEEKDKYLKLHTSLAADEDAEEYSVRKQLSLQISGCADKLIIDLDTLGRLDLLIAKAALAVKMPSCRPVIGECLTVNSAHNPLIADNLGDSQFTPISLQADNGTTIITGANMGGKTVALRTIALNCYLALCGFFAFSESLSLPHFEFIDIVSDNLSSTDRNLSSFGGEAVRIDQLYRTADKKGLILIDEFAAGTNADEGARIFRAVAKSFDCKHSTVIMTTHFDGVAGSGSAYYQIIGLKNAPLSTMEQLLRKNPEGGINLIAKYMDYGLVKVDKDVPVPKDAINICKMLGISKDILDRID